MGRPKKSSVSTYALEQKEHELSTIQADVATLQKDYEIALQNDPQYSLDVDPEDKYHMTPEQKVFVKQYIEYKSVGIAAELAKIDKDTAMSFLTAYSSQEEIRRINRALYHRQFNNKILSLDQLGGYLSSLLMDENIPIADRLSTRDKLRVVEMLIDLNRMKMDSYSDPSILMARDIDIQIKSLSVATIQQLLNQSQKPRPITIYAEDGTSLSPEENAYLSTLPTDEILQLLDETNKKGEQNNDTEQTGS